ncbi:F-box/LRR-repeat protein At2g42730-like [Rhododendron vialii]|uniref:F-box/LRR-repeat protein At2g42730-like n=1 Tax=Rhododendron vialii TaxID=182163 RepID=UPI00265E53C2|nr:F-box/LRR-repeat protein At2g42730-like [Rhododendron vialii]
MDDRISVLPDEIVCTLLSLLTMKEAARTSVLSHRWENLWKYFTGSLDFDGSKTMDRMEQEMEISLENFEMSLKTIEMSLETERAKYINWVNKVLNLHQGQDIDGFRVCFDLDKKSACIIDGWINFAMGKRVRRLELDLIECSAVRIGQSYTFSLSSLRVLNVSSLTALCLRNVDMTDEVLAHFLSNCPLIEELSLMESESLVNIKIASALKLKRLELIICNSLKNVEISAINLVSFKYFGPRINNPFKNVPLLSEVSMGGSHWERVVCDPFSSLSGVLYQLETLVLRLDFEFSDRGCFTRTTFPEFLNLKKVELQVTAYSDQSILCLTSLIDASPCLYKLVLKLRYSSRCFSEPDTEAEEFAVWRRGKPREEGRSRRLECLKVVEIAGWVGNTSDTEFALNLLENAALLDKIIIDPSHPSFLQRRVSTCCWNAEPNVLAGARERAKLLETKLPPGTELVIVC